MFWNPIHMNKKHEKIEILQEKLPHNEFMKKVAFLKTYERNNHLS